MENLLKQHQIEINLPELSVNALICLILALVLLYHFRRYSQVTTNRTYFSRVFPIISLTTLLIITVVKSSLALSLGLVGALSIVRFRTPIKEPEELAYIFLAIAVGLGLGANQRTATLLLFVVIIIVMTGLAYTKIAKRQRGQHLSVSMPRSADVGDIEKSALDEMRQFAVECHMIRVDFGPSRLDMVFHVEFDDTANALRLVDGLSKKFPDAEVSMIDQNDILI